VKRNARRNAEIVAAVNQGAKPTDVARQYGLSRERIRQIVSAARRRAKNPYWLLGVRIHNALATHFNDDFGRDPERDSTSVRGMSEARDQEHRAKGPAGHRAVARDRPRHLTREPEEGLALCMKALRGRPSASAFGTKAAV